MDESDPDERTRRLKRILREELDDREGVTDYEITHTDDPGVHLIAEEDDGTSHYHVTLERHPEGNTKTRWNYLGSDRDE
jgi:hypothetical protein